MPDTATLYETDWYAWTQEQAARLRDLPPSLRPNGLDIENLAEEVEDLGGSQRRTVRSLMRETAVHLLKIEFHPAAASRPHWEDEIAAFRGQIDSHFEDSPSLRARRADLASQAWPQALCLIRARRNRADFGQMIRDMDAAGISPDALRYDVDTELLDLSWYPGTSSD